jgi:hypothetical protein
VQHRFDDFHQALQDFVSSSSSTSSNSMTTTTPSKSTRRVCTKSKSKSSSESTSTPHTKTKTLYDQSLPYEAVRRATRPIFFFVAFRGVVGLGIRRMADLLRAFLFVDSVHRAAFSVGSFPFLPSFLFVHQMLWCRNVSR